MIRRLGNPAQITECELIAVKRKKHWLFKTVPSLISYPSAVNDNFGSRTRIENAYFSQHNIRFVVSGLFAEENNMFSTVTYTALSNDCVQYSLSRILLIIYVHTISLTTSIQFLLFY